MDAETQKVIEAIPGLIQWITQKQRALWAAHLDDHKAMIRCSRGICERDEEAKKELQERAGLFWKEIENLEVTLAGLRVTRAELQMAQRPNRTATTEEAAATSTGDVNPP